MKTCIKCKELLENKRFFKDKSRKDGLHPYCKTCFYLSFNKENRRKYEKRYWDKHRDKKRAMVRSANRKYYKKYHEKRQQRYKTEEFILQRKMSDLSRRLRKFPLIVTKAELKALLRASQYCFYCKKSLKDVKVEVDHKTPLARGGKNEIENLVASCQTCNRKKGTKTAGEFLREV